MELEQYISTDIIESYVLGLASPEEVAQLHQLRLHFPALDIEIASVEGRIERGAFGEAVMPPARVWQGIQQHLSWESARQEKTAEAYKHYSVIDMQPREGAYISVHRSWKTILLVFFILSKIFLVGALYYYFKSQSLQEKLDAIQHPQTISATK